MVWDVDSPPVVPSPSFSSLALRLRSSMPSISRSLTRSRPLFHSSSTRSRSSSYAVCAHSIAYRSSISSWANIAERSVVIGRSRRLYSGNVSGRVDSCRAVLCSTEILSVKWRPLRCRGQKFGVSVVLSRKTAHMIIDSLVSSITHLFSQLSSDFSPSLLFLSVIERTSCSDTDAIRRL
jgi:hypothetical protein